MKKQYIEQAIENDFIWEQPNVSLNLKNLCTDLANMFGDTTITQTFTVLGNKNVSIRIEIEEMED